MKQITKKLALLIFFSSVVIGLASCKKEDNNKINNNDTQTPTFVGKWVLDSININGQTMNRDKMDMEVNFFANGTGWAYSSTNEFGDFTWRVQDDKLILKPGDEYTLTWTIISMTNNSAVLRGLIDDDQPEATFYFKKESNTPNPNPNPNPGNDTNVNPQPPITGSWLNYCATHYTDSYASLVTDLTQKGFTYVGEEQEGNMKINFFMNSDESVSIMIMTANDNVCMLAVSTSGTSIAHISDVNEVPSYINALGMHGEIDISNDTTISDVEYEDAASYISALNTAVATYPDNTVYSISADIMFFNASNMAICHWDNEGELVVGYGTIAAMAAMKKTMRK